MAARTAVRSSAVASPSTRIAATCIGEPGTSEASCIRSVGLVRSITTRAARTFVTSVRQQRVVRISSAAIPVLQVSISAQSRKSPSGTRTAMTRAFSPKPSRCRSTTPAKTRCSTARVDADDVADLDRRLVRLRRVTDRAAREQPHRARRLRGDPFRDVTGVAPATVPVDGAAQDHRVVRHHIAHLAGRKHLDDCVVGKTGTQHLRRSGPRSPRWNRACWRR